MRELFPISFPEDDLVMFCKVRVRSVGYEISYKIHRTVGYGYGNITELTELSGKGMKVLQNSLNLVG